MSQKVSLGNAQIVIIIILLVLLTALVSGGGVYFWQQAKIAKLEKSQSFPSPTISLPTIIPFPTKEPSPKGKVEPTPTLKVTKSDSELIKIAFAEKYGKPQNEVNITINKNTGSHASGSVKFAGEMGGGMWLAAKVNGKWVIVYDGHGVILCKVIKPYNFPKEIVSECYDEDAQKTIQL